MQDAIISTKFDLNDIPGLCYDGIAIDAKHTAFIGREWFCREMKDGGWSGETSNHVYDLAMEEIRLAVLLSEGLHESDTWQEAAIKLNKELESHGGWAVFIES